MLSTNKELLISWRANITLLLYCYNSTSSTNNSDMSVRLMKFLRANPTYIEIYGDASIRIT